MMLVSAVSISGSSGAAELTNTARSVGPSFGTDSNDVRCFDCCFRLGLEWFADQKVSCS